MKKIAIHQSNYIPWKGYFDIMNSVDVFVIYDEVQYTKNDWRNRNKINTKRGLQWLTIPVYVGSLDQKIYQTKISFSKWNRKHWNALKTTYGKASFFKDYEEFFEELYLREHSNYLTEVNQLFLRKINELLNIDTEIVNSLDLDLTGDKNERLIQAIKRLNGSCYLSGPAAKSYLNEDLFRQQGIGVEWKDYSNYKIYTQFGKDFEHGVSILDVIFNLGVDKSNWTNG